VAIGDMMAHFAKIDADNKVTEVLVVPNEQEHRGNEYLNELGLVGTWVQTSYNASFGGQYAGVGDTWDGANFVSPVVITEEPTE
jgi:hypothetical protein